MIRHAKAPADAAGVIRARDVKGRALDRAVKDLLEEMVRPRRRARLETAEAP